MVHNIGLLPFGRSLFMKMKEELLHLEKIETIQKQLIWFTYSETYPKMESYIIMDEELCLSTYTSLLQLFKSSKIIQIPRPWQSTKSTRTKINGKEAIQVEVTLLKRLFSITIHIAPKLFPLGFKWVCNHTINDLISV